MAPKLLERLDDVPVKCALGIAKENPQAWLTTDAL